MKQSADVERKAVIKNREELDLIADYYREGQGWVLPGQYFPEANIKFAGREVLVIEQWKNVWATKLEDDWHFFSKDALKFLGEQCS